MEDVELFKACCGSWREPRLLDHQRFPVGAAQAMDDMVFALTKEQADEVPLWLWITVGHRAEVQLMCVSVTQASNKDYPGLVNKVDSTTRHVWLSAETGAES